MAHNRCDAVSGPAMSADLIAGIRRDRLAAFAAREAETYIKARPKAAKALKDGAGTFLGGVPMHWMADWPMPHLPLVAKAHGARIDGHRRLRAGRLLPRRHRLDVRPFPRPGRQGHPPAGPPWPDLHAADRSRACRPGVC
jgi:hypothetical protein